MSRNLTRNEKVILEHWLKRYLYQLLKRNGICSLMCYVHVHIFL
jgi:hypothetical protein